MTALLYKAVQRLEPWQIWVNPDFGLKTRDWAGNESGARKNGHSGEGDAGKAGGKEGRVSCLCWRVLTAGQRWPEPVSDSGDRFDVLVRICP